MKNIIFTILALFSLCQTSSAYDNLLIKKKDGKVVMHDIRKVVDVTFEDINETTVMDISYTGFDFKGGNTVDAGSSGNIPGRSRWQRLGCC